MKNSILFLLFASLTTTSFAQFPGGGMPGMPGGAGNQRQTNIPGTSTDPTPRGNGKISGVLMDSTTNKPVEFATVALLNPKTGKPIDGTTSDDKGRYTITKIAPGEYRLQFGFVGYKNKESAPVKIEKGSEILMGLTKLSADVRTLGEVQVVGQAALIEEKVDRLVYNADKDITAKGGDATDIMRKVPMLSVDLDGNVTLRGSSNVRVLINNKPSTIVASSVADALKQIPADMIKTVEVITSPSAKYDAEGSAGIINIVTKKNTLQGFTLNTDVGQGNRGTSLNLNGSYRQGKMGFTLGGFGRAEYNVHGRFSNVQTTQNALGTTTQYQTADTRRSGVFGNYQLGWDYDISKNSSITASLRYGARNGNNYQDRLLTQTYTPLGPNLSLSEAARNVKTIDNSGTVDANITYTHTYKPQQELSVLALYSRNNRTNNFVADLLGGTDFQTRTGGQSNINPSTNQESTLQVDYQTPIKQNQLLEIGGKGIFRQVDSQYQYLRQLSPESPNQPDPTRPNNGLNYNQNIAASYVAYTYTTKSKYTLKAGLRYEYTFINANFTNEGTAASTTTTGPTSASAVGAIPNYGLLVPSVNLSKSLKGGRTIKVGYNRRIQRPGIQFLNPNLNASNPTNVSVGNPTLSPEKTDNVELGLSGQLKAFYLNATLFGRRTTGEITSVRTVDSTATGDITNPVYNRVIKTSYANIGREDAIGLNLFTNVTLFSKLQLGGGVDVFHVNLTNNVADPTLRASNSGWVVSGRLFSTLTLKSGWAVQAFGGMRGKQVQLQGYQGTFAFYNLGVRKEFNEKRGTIGLAAENFLNFPFRVNSQFQSPVLTQVSQTSFYNAGFRVNFSYRIGKLSFDQPQRRKKSINNDDEKSEGGGDQPQQQTAPAGGAGNGGGRPRGK